MQSMRIKNGRENRTFEHVNLKCSPVYSIYSAVLCWCTDRFAWMCY